MKEIIVNNILNVRTTMLVEDGKLIEKYEENESINRLEGNIYLGKVTDVLPGMQAAFVDIGDDKNAFLHIKDILPKLSNETGNKNTDFSKYNIKEYVKTGMNVIVEVKKDKTGKKGAKVSTNLNIGGRFVAIIPNSNFITISKKIENEEKVAELKNIVGKLGLRKYGVIIRTAAMYVTESEIIEDINNVISIYESILNQANKIDNKNIPIKLYEKGNLIKRLIVDLGYQDLEKITVNNVKDYDEIKEILSKYNLNKISLDFLEKDLMQFYDLEKQIDKISNRKVWLKCGGFITIDKTEALTAIDVNSGKFTGKENIEQTVLKVNSEATIEIAKQLRARDIGGIVIIDYIDMETKEDEALIQSLLVESLKKDRAKTQVVGFTKLHLLEMTRKHICSEKD